MGTFQYKCQSFVFFLLVAWICIRIRFSNLRIKVKMWTFFLLFTDLRDLSCNWEGGSPLWLSLSSLIQRTLKEQSTKGQLQAVQDWHVVFTLSASRSWFPFYGIKNVSTCSFFNSHFCYQPPNKMLFLAVNACNIQPVSTLQISLCCPEEP